MALPELVVRIGGAAGDGVSSAGEMLAKVCARSGLHVKAFSGYQSVIRGGHVWFQVRAAEAPPGSHGDDPDVLVALNQQTADVWGPIVRKGGALLFDATKVKPDASRLREGVQVLGAPLLERAKQFGKNPIMQNTVALGAVLQLYDWPSAVLEDVLRWNFEGKKDEVIQANLGAAAAGATWAREHARPLAHTLRADPSKRRMLIAGNQAFGLGMVAGGLQFYAAYPMTPASSVLHYLAGVAADAGVVVKQAEDELAVMNMTIGAAFAGARAACGTSGGGFALMTEAVGLAAMTEVGVVILESQRGGPSTGLPTKTEQGDLNQAFGASQGDFPRIILAPTSLDDMYRAGHEALDLAAKYQCPVIVLSDLYLSEHMGTMEEPSVDVRVERGEDARAAAGSPFARYAFTESGVSPRASPGTKGLAFIAGSDEHDEYGALISDVRAGLPEELTIRNKMVEKRMRKVDTALRELPPPKLVGPADAQVTLVGWGSTDEVLEETRAILSKRGLAANHLQIRYVVPFHAKEVRAVLSRSQRRIMVEANFSGQMERHIRAETGLDMHGHVRRYDGEPFLAAEIAGEVMGKVK